MITTHRIRRSVVCALVIGAPSLPAAAQAKLNLEPASSAAPVTATTAAASATGPAQPRAGAGTQAGFQWGDAGIGAAGTAVLLGTGMLAYAAPRRRRTQRVMTG